MPGNKITISGTGCALADFLYTNVRFNNPGFRRYRSLRPGDGGLSPGRLVFTEELEQFSGKPYEQILKDLTEGAQPDTFNIGGPGLVSMIHTAQILDNDMFSLKFYGSLGKDQTADRILEKASKTPLDISNYRPMSVKPTPFTDVLSDPTYENGNGERSFVNNIGAAWDFNPGLLPDEFFRSRIVCFGGTALVPNIHDNLSLLLLRAKKNDCLTVVNTVYDFRSEKSRPDKPWPLGTGDSFPLIDVLLMDQEEALKISRCNILPLAVDFFIRQRVSCFCITNGPADLTIFSDGNLFEKTPPTFYPVSRLVTDTFRKNGDTTGCGDNFTGGFIASIALQLNTKSKGNFSISEALALAVSSGGFTTSYKGGAFEESFTGEKWQKIRPMYDDYLIQISKK